MNGAAAPAASWSLRRAFASRWTAAVAVLILAEFAARGPLRAVAPSGSGDLAVGWAAARVWLAGGDPYDMEQVGRAFRDGGGPPDLVPTRENMPFIYPAPFLVLEAPLAPLRWPWAVALNTAATLAAVLAALLALLRRAGLEDGEAAFAALAVLALAPLQTGLSSGQGAMPAIALATLGWTMTEESPVLGGALACVGAAFKPHVALPFLILFALRPRLRFAAAGFAVAALLTAAGAARLAAGGHHWIGDWLAAVAAAAGSAGANSPAPGNPRAVSMVNAEVLLLRLPLGAAARTAALLLLTLPAAALAAWRLRSARTRREELTALSLLCVAALLSMYHRTYDAYLLALPAAALTARRAELGPASRALAALCLAAFLWPGAPVLDALTALGWIPAGVAASWPWKALVLPHQTWALIALEGVLAALVLRPCGDPALTVQSSGT